MGSTPVGWSPSPEPSTSPALRVATYNILLGGGGRWPEITQLLRAIDADLVALQEAEDQAAVERAADQLGYQVFFGLAPTPRHQAVLSRLPVTSWTNHRDQAIFLRNSLELWMEPPSGSQLSTICLHTVHLTAAFHRRGRAEPERVRELAAVRGHAAEHPEAAHLILGDFNAVAPGDRVRATDFFAQINQWRRSGVLQEAGALGPVPPGLAHLRWWQDPEAREAIPEELPEAVRSGLPRLPWLVHPLLEVLPRGDATDAVLGALLPRAAVRSMLRAGYADCLRTLHPRASAFTCPSYQPAVRIDYIFASKALAQRLTRCEVVGRSGELAGLARRASDHFPVMAEFRLGPLGSSSH
ncbi:MAG TPA: endonuclease/exonuclease/phosphatase family protein [Candidatus Dormibacteraeota bacterium]|nr:endonuclease/exonuclease/phosphatase family protein [Candidatus Dormibacteraeota bacterium]